MRPSSGLALVGLLALPRAFAAPAACSPGGGFYFGGDGRSDAIDWLWAHKDYFNGLPRWYFHFNLASTPLWGSNPYIDRVIMERLDPASGSFVPMYSFMPGYGRDVDPIYDAQTKPGVPADPTTQMTVRVRFYDDDDTGCPSGSTPAVTMQHYNFIGSAREFAAVAGGAAPGATPAWLHPFNNPVELCDAGGPWAPLRDAPPSAWLGSVKATKLCDCSWRIDVQYSGNPLMVNNPFIDYVSFRVASPGGSEQIRMVLHQPGTSSYRLVTSKLSCDTDYLNVNYVVYFDEFDGIPGYITRLHSCFAVPKPIVGMCLANGVGYSGSSITTSCGGLGSANSAAKYTGGGSCGESPEPNPVPVPVPVPVPTPAPIPQPQPTPAPVSAATLAPTKADDASPAPVPGVDEPVTLTVTGGAGASYTVHEVYSNDLAASGDVADMDTVSGDTATVNMKLSAGCYRLAVSAGDDPAGLTWELEDTGISGGALEVVDFAAGGSLCSAGKCMRDCYAAAAADAAGKDSSTCDVFSAAIASSCASKCSTAERRAAKSACYNHAGCGSSARESCGLEDIVKVADEGRAAVSVLLSGLSGDDLTASDKAAASVAGAAAAWLGVSASDVNVTAINGELVNESMWIGARRRRLAGSSSRAGRRLQTQEGFARMQLTVSTATSKDATTVASTAQAGGASLQALIASMGLAGFDGAAVETVKATPSSVYVLDFNGDAAGGDGSGAGSTSSSDDSAGMGNGSGSGSDGSSSSSSSGKNSKVVIAVAVACGAAAGLAVLAGVAVALKRRKRRRFALPVKPQVSPDTEQPHQDGGEDGGAEDFPDDSSVAPLA